MQRSWIAPLCLALLSHVGCQPPEAPGAPGPSPATPGGDPAPAVGSVTLELSGALRCEPERDPAGAFELSAPILPRTDVVYNLEGDAYPATAAAEADAAHRAALTYPFLLGACAPLYPAIRLPARPGDVLTPAERETNFGAVARCAYERYLSKPYWLPLMVDHVDICGTELGAEWHMVTQADLSALSDGDLRRIADKLGGLAMGVGAISGYYFSLQTYLRAADGSLALGDFTPGAPARVLPFPVSGERLKFHLENGGRPLSLRCVRRVP